MKSKSHMPKTVTIRQIYPRVPLGKVYVTPGAAALGVDLLAFLARHLCGDWGEELCAQDRRANERDLIQGRMVMSSYRTANGDKLWIITEWDRSRTTILLPAEY